MKTACASSLVVSVLILCSGEQIETCLSYSSLFSGEKKSMKDCLPEQDALELLMHVHMKLTVGINHHTTTCFINDPREANSSHMIQF